MNNNNAPIQPSNNNWQTLFRLTGMDENHSGTDF